MALIRWLNEHTKFTFLSYYYLNGTKAMTGAYYQYEGSSEFVQQINQHKSLIAQKQTIIEREDKTLQNSFHYLFSNEIFSSSSGIKDEYCVSSIDTPSVVVTSKVSFATRTCSCYTCEAANEKDDAFLTKLYRSHKSMLEHKRLNKVSETIQQEKEKILSALLSPFQKDDEGLMQALLAKDINKQTPLFCAFKNRNSLLGSILERIKLLKDVYKEQLLLERNTDDKSLAHIILLRYPNVEEMIKLFGEQAFLQAMLQTDKDGNKILYDVLKADANRSGKIKCVANLLEITKSVEVKDAADIQENLFCQNRDGLNPFHLLCQESKNFDESLEIAQSFMQMLPETMLPLKLMERDNLGYTPIHHAIKNGNFTLARSLLVCLNKLDKKLICGIEDSQHETPLHFACRYGDNQMLRFVIESLGPAEFYRIRKQSPNLMELVKANKRLSESDFNSMMYRHNILFNCFDYFEKNYSSSSNFVLRLSDFRTCYSILDGSKSKRFVTLPAENPAFYAKSHLGGLFKGSEKYHELRAKLNTVTQEEMDEFRLFLSLSASIESGDKRKSNSTLLASSILEGLSSKSDPVPHEIILPAERKEPSAPPLNVLVA